MFECRKDVSYCSEEAWIDRESKIKGDLMFSLGYLPAILIIKYCVLLGQIGFGRETVKDKTRPTPLSRMPDLQNDLE